MTQKKQAGVYAIVNHTTGKVYVGSAAYGTYNRKCEHLAELRAGVHCNKYLQRSFTKHGEAAFEFTVLEECDPADCLRLEQWWMDYLQSADPKFGYNRNPVAGSMLGFKHSEQSKLLIGRRGKGRRHNRKTRERISEKMSIVMLGNKHFEGHSHTDRAKRKIAAAARKQWQSEAHRKLVAKKNRKAAKHYYFALRFVSALTGIPIKGGRLC
jgi:group I intron endonuclease